MIICLKSIAYYSNVYYFQCTSLLHEHYNLTDLEISFIYKLRLKIQVNVKSDPKQVKIL